MVCPAPVQMLIDETINGHKQFVSSRSRGYIPRKNGAKDRSDEWAHAEYCDLGIHSNKMDLILDHT